MRRLLVSLAAERGIVELDGRAELLPVADDPVDVLASTRSTHHRDDPVAAFPEPVRVLRPGGQVRIYDVRFAGYTRKEARRIAAAASTPHWAVTHQILPERLFDVRPYTLITITEDKERT